MITAEITISVGHLPELVLEGGLCWFHPVEAMCRPAAGGGIDGIGEHGAAAKGPGDSGAGGHDDVGSV